MVESIGRRQGTRRKGQRTMPIICMKDVIYEWLVCRAPHTENAKWDIKTMATGSYWPENESAFQAATRIYGIFGYYFVVSQ